jgi:methionyl-tRNA formyltransferase
MRDLRVVFMGTPDFAVGVLSQMLKAHINVVAVVTSTDKPAGRGRKLRPSAVKQFALEHNLPVLQPPNLKDETFLAQLRHYNANLFVVVAFRMLPKVVWDMPEFATFNLHASLLPEYRGAAPINWAIINGEKRTGVTTFFIDEEIDSGELILQEAVDISPDETAGSLHDKLMATGSQLVVATIRLIERDEVRPMQQPVKADLKAAPKLTRENTRIDWANPYKTIDALVRGLCPYPAAWTELEMDGGLIKAKIYEVAYKNERHKLVTGTIVIDEKQILVAIPDGFIAIEQIQLAGKRKLAARDLLNGFQFNQGAKFV